MDTGFIILLVVVVLGPGLTYLGKSAPQRLVW